MDFLKLNNEFQNLQKKLEESEIYVKKINNYIRKIDKDILKLEQKIEIDKDNLQRNINILILEIKKEFKNILEDILKVD